MNVSRILDEAREVSNYKGNWALSSLSAYHMGNKLEGRRDKIKIKAFETMY